MFHVSLVYEQTFSDGENANLACQSCSPIDVVWASYGVQISRQIPIAISSNNQNCTTDATSIMQRKCNGKDQCSFTVQRNELLQSSCREKTTLLVCYKCKSNPPGTGLQFIQQQHKQHSIGIVPKLVQVST